MRFFIDMYFLYLRRYDDLIEELENENWLKEDKRRAKKLMRVLFFTIFIMVIFGNYIPNNIINIIILCSVIIQVILLPFVLLTLKMDKKS